MSLALRILTGRLIQEGIHEEAVVHSLLTSVIHRIIDFSANNDSVSFLDMTPARSSHSLFKN